MLFRNANDAPQPQSPEEIQADIPRWHNWINSIVEQGKFVSTQPLDYQGAVVKKDTVTDGPFAEVKEMIYGYLICKAKDLAEAIELSKSCPIIQKGGSVEVREINMVYPATRQEVSQTGEAAANA